VLYQSSEQDLADLQSRHAQPLDFDFAAAKVILE
jgi:hypothetical protein